jgi:hypothetical protein
LTVLRVVWKFSLNFQLIVPELYTQVHACTRTHTHTHTHLCAPLCFNWHLEAQTAGTDSGVPRNFVQGGVQQIQFTTEGIENGDLGAVVPLSGVPLNLQSGWTSPNFRDVWMYFPRNWQFGSALSKLRNFGWGVQPPNSPPRYATGNSTGISAEIKINR